MHKEKKRWAAVFLTLVMLSFAGCGQWQGSQSIEESGVGEESEEVKLSLADTQGYYGSLFGGGKEIIDIQVEIEQEDWDDILANPTAEEYHAANITVNGIRAEQVGFRTKGFSSLTTVAQSDSDRYGFRVKMDKYVDGQTLEGLDELVLNGSFADPSYMREYLTYAASAYLEGVTPYVTYANLYINGELFGLYLCIEAYDDSFSQRYSEGEDTRLYKADSESCTLLPSDDASGFDQKYGADNTQLLLQLIEVLNSLDQDNTQELEAILDVSSVLKAIAVNTVMGNYDSYSGSKAHNYYLLYTAGRFRYVGWDYNMSIGGYNEDDGASVTVDIQSPVYNVDISQRPLIEKLLAVESYYEEYKGYLQQLMTYLSDFEGMVEQLSSVIRSAVEQDPTAFYTIEQYDAAITASDTDLSQVTGRQGGFGGGQLPEGTFPGEGFPDDGQRPEGSFPAGETFPGGEDFPEGLPDFQGRTDMDAASQQPEELTPPDSSGLESGAAQQEGDPQLPQGGMEDAPTAGDGGSQRFSDGATPPQLPDGASMPEGMTPPDRMEDLGGFGGGMISHEPCSIVDYILQRIANIHSQLEEAQQ